MDGGAWWAALYGVAQSRTRLRWLSSIYIGASLVAQSVKHLPAVQETRVRSLGWEDPLEKEMATTTVFLPGKSHGQRSLVYIWAFLVAKTVKNLPAIQGTQVPSLGQEDPLEKEIATHSNILAWKSSWRGAWQSTGFQRVRHDWVTKHSAQCICVKPSLPVHLFHLPPWNPCVCPLPLCLYCCFVNKIIRNIFSRVHIFVLTCHFCFSPSALFTLWNVVLQLCSHDRISLHPLSLTSLDCWSSISATLRSSESGNQRKVGQLNPPALSIAVFACPPAWQTCQADHIRLQLIKLEKHTQIFKRSSHWSTFMYRVLTPIPSPGEVVHSNSNLSAVSLQY